MRKIKKWKIPGLFLILALLAGQCVSAQAFSWQQYIAAPEISWQAPGVADGQVTAEGNYLLFTSDVHRYTALTADLLAEADSIVRETDGDSASVGVIAIAGDFANEQDLYGDVMTILKHAIEEVSPGTVACYTKGNHEGNVSDEDFITLTGMPRIGETVISAANAYYFYNFGAYDSQQNFLEEDISSLSAFLEEHNDGKPIFILSHYPLHYYNDRRITGNADKVVDLLNQYPQAVFLWGHNHTEEDPSYGTIRTAGDVIQTGAGSDTTREISFTYASAGALRDGLNGANGLLIRVGEGTLQYWYLGLDTSVSDKTWTDAEGNENPLRTAGRSASTSSGTVAIPNADSLHTISIVDVGIERPRVDESILNAVSCWSERYSAGPLLWSGGVYSDTAYAFSTEYTATVTLTAQDGYQFDTSGALRASVNKQYVGPMEDGTLVGQDDHTAVIQKNTGRSVTISYTFPATLAQSGTPYDAVDTITDGVQYVLACAESNTAMYYRYASADPGKKSMPDYTVEAADAVIRKGQLVSAPDPFTVFTAQTDGDGFLLWSDANLNDPETAGTTPRAETLNYLSLAARGEDLNIEASEKAGIAANSRWYVENGIPFLNVDGTNLYAAYQNGAFTLVTDASEANVRLYAVGSSAPYPLYNVSVNLDMPVPGTALDTADEIDYPGYTVTGVTWDAETADYGTEYTATVTVSPKDGWSFAEPMTGRISGGEASISVGTDGTATLTRTFSAAGTES